jgi:hypothetical protein
MLNEDFSISLALYHDRAEEVETDILLSQPFSVSHMQFV